MSASRSEYLICNWLTAFTASPSSAPNEPSSRGLADDIVAERKRTGSVTDATVIARRQIKLAGSTRTRRKRLSSG